MARWGWVLSTVFAVTIDQASFEPVYRQLARILRDQIQAGDLRPGAPLPSEATLSQTFGVGCDAVRDALALRDLDDYVGFHDSAPSASGSR